MSIALVHAKYLFLETVRIPIAVIAPAFFPAASMLFFVVPFAGDDATGATLRLLAGVGAVLVAAVPFTLMGLAIGYWLPSKAALAVTNILFFPLAFGGGLLANPEDLPGFIETIAPYLPTRGAVELMWAAVAGFEPNPTSLVMLGVWIVACGGLAAFAYRRDEGRCFT